MTSETTNSIPYLVVGIDGSDSSVEALKWALRHAVATGLGVHAVIAWEFPNLYGGYPLTDGIDWRGNAQQTIDNALSTTPAPEGVKVSVSVTEGHPVPVLLDASKGAELLVVGNRGHGGFAGMLLGSVSERVIAHASCPVLVVPRPSA